MNRLILPAIVTFLTGTFLNAQVADIALQPTHEGQMIEKSASLAMEVRNVDSAYARIVRIVDEKDAEITSSTISETGSEPDLKISRADLSIITSPENFSALLTELEELGVLTEKEVYGYDVTEEYHRLRAEYYSQLALKSRLSRHANRSGNVNTVLMLEEDLERIENEIRRIQSRITHLESATTESNINLVITRKTAVTMSGWEKTTRWFFGGLAAVAVLAPIAGLGLLITWLVVLIARKKKKS